MENPEKIPDPSFVLTILDGIKTAARMIEEKERRQKERKTPDYIIQRAVRLLKFKLIRQERWRVAHNKFNGVEK